MQRYNCNFKMAWISTNRRALTLATLLLITNYFDTTFAGGYGSGYGNAGASASSAASASASSFSTANNWQTGGFGNGGQTVGNDYGTNPFLTNVAHNGGSSSLNNAGGKGGLSFSVHKEVNVNGLKEGLNGIKEGVAGFVGGIIGGMHKLRTDIHGNGGGLISGLLKGHKNSAANNGQAGFGGTYAGAGATATANAFANANAGTFDGSGSNCGNGACASSIPAINYNPCNSPTCGRKPIQGISTPNTAYLTPTSVQQQPSFNKPQQSSWQPNSVPNNWQTANQPCFGGQCGPQNHNNNQQPSVIQTIPAKPKVHNKPVYDQQPCATGNCNNVPKNQGGYGDVACNGPHCGNNIEKPSSGCVGSNCGGYAQPSRPCPEPHCNGVFQPLPTKPKEQSLISTPSFVPSSKPNYNTLPKANAHHSQPTYNDKPIWPTFQLPNFELNKELSVGFNGGFGGSVGTGTGAQTNKPAGCATGTCAEKSGHNSFAGANANANANAHAASSSSSKTGSYGANTQPAGSGCSSGNCGNSCATGQCNNGLNNFNSGNEHASSNAFSGTYATASASSSASAISSGYWRK